MFLSVYKTTLKNLFRSLLFWLLLALLIAVPMERAVNGFCGYYNFDYREMIYDTDPRFVLNEEPYINNIHNNCASTLLYAMPLFAVISVVLILNRDYGDNFYEIERAGNQRPIRYLTGRLAALLTVNLLAFLVVIIFTCHWYVFTRGGVVQMETGAYLLDSTVRMLRIIVVMGWPPIVMLVCFAYALGSLLRSAWGAAAIGVGYIIVNYVTILRLRFRMPEWYGNYFGLIPDHLRRYISFYDSRWFGTEHKMQGSDLTKVWICLGILLGAAAIYGTVSYLRVRSRET